MPKRMTKTQAQRMLVAIRSKMFKLYQEGYVTLKDVDGVASIVKRRSDQLTRK